MAVFGAVLLIATAGSFLAGRFIHPPERAALAAAQEDVAATTTVQRRVVDSRSSYAGEVKESPLISVTARALPDVPVVTRQELTAGETLASGDLVAVIAGAPYFVFTGPLPLYRDLRAGDRGDDVEALQHALNTAGADIDVSGWIDWSTTNALETLFEDAGFALPEEVAPDGKKTTTIPAVQLLGTATASGALVSAAEVGTTLASDTPLITVRTAPNSVTFRADAVASAQLTPDITLTAQAGTATFPVTVTSIGEFTAGSNGQLPGRDVLLSSTDPAFLALPPGASVTVLSAGADEEALAVPLTAIRQDNEGDYVSRRVVTDGKTSSERVAVTVDRSGGGWAAIEEGALAEGDVVMLS
ncbi:hypothetical protein ITJ45_11785 [Rathayibacter sp. VKM Ac-2879]|uniref:hypothetical protein n=1 Tax=Rathayibacter sp. VKM Ac-2879 TaxID=2783832 RepID=UPI001889DF74|nr:hypothetical protein [Rathayibacter sp. VKM Ac-2879]MBF4463202.1 hypothetical protein [Rathayibacter sp. VKM Ac-2879]